MVVKKIAAVALPKRVRHRERQIGAVPGTLVEREGVRPSTLSQTIANVSGLDQRTSTDVELGFEPQAGTLNWIDMTGLGTLPVLREIGKRFDLHDLILEDIVNTDQRPSASMEQGHLVIRMRMPKPLATNEGYRSEQLVLVVQPGTVLSFQEEAGDSFDSVRKRLVQGGPRLRSGNAGYFAYALIDAVIDSYYPVLEALGERLEALEEEVLDQPRHDHIAAIHSTKQQIAQIRRELWPLRDVVRELVRLADDDDDEELPFSTVQSIYLRDCEDHVLQLLEFSDAFTQVANDVRDIYHTSVAARLNDIMRVLTIMASIFIPLSFFAGLYGMNFDTDSPYNLPELSFRFGYPVLLSLMFAMAVGMLVFFWKKGWLNQDGTG